MKRHALFIGIDRYEDPQLRSLDCAEEDAVELHGFFKHRAGYHAQCLRSPSSAEVLEAVERLVAGLAPGDLFLFFFAGHGVAHAGQHLLLCAKARHSRLHHKQEVVPVDLLKQETARAGVHRIFLLDACRSELLKTRKAGGSGFNGTNALRDVVALPTGNASAADGSLTLVCSCDEGGQASEINALKGGVFRLAFQAALTAAAQEARGLAVGEGLINELKERMARLAEKHGIVSEQRPWFQKAGEPPLLLMGRPGATTARPPVAPVAPAASAPPVLGLPVAVSPSVGLFDRVQAEAAERKASAKRSAAAAVAEAAARRQQFERLYPQYEAVLGNTHVTEEGRQQAWAVLCRDLGVTDAPTEAGTLRWLESQAQVVCGVRYSIVTRERPWMNSLGMRFVPVAGPNVLFCMWETRVQDYRVFAEAIAAATAGKSPGFLASIFGWDASPLGLNRSWRELNFKQGDTHPVVKVNWNEAEAFCRWLTEKEREEGKLTAEQRYRLPRDWEWSVAVGLNERRWGTPKGKGGEIKDVYPWGKEWPPPNKAGNYAPNLGVDAYQYTSPVGSFGVNQFGLFDLGGNVWEWCEDAYNMWSGDRVLRGASFKSGHPGSYHRDCLWSSCRLYREPVHYSDDIGFRVVLVGGESR